MTANRHRFRAWDKMDNRWYPHERGEWINMCSDGGVVHGFEGDIDEPDEARFEIQMSTGLTDKAGKEIYEGDIVRQEDSLDFSDDEGEDLDRTYIGEVVVLPQKGACLRFPFVTDNFEGTSELSKRYINVRRLRCEIIGNIHETPELLRPAT